MKPDPAPKPAPVGQVKPKPAPVKPVPAPVAAGPSRDDLTNALEATLKRLSANKAARSDIAKLKDQFRPETKAVFLESPGSLTAD